MILAVISIMSDMDDGTVGTSLDIQILLDTADNCQLPLIIAGATFCTVPGCEEVDSLKTPAA